MLTNCFGVDTNLASALYSLPFLISAVISPFLGLLIDKIGQRALLIMSSSALVTLACIITMILVGQDY
jgi:MFS family permease